MPSLSSDRNLLFGIVALQMDFISRDALVEAMNAWALDKSKPLGQILLDRGAIAADDRAVLDAVVEKQVQKHGGDARQSLMMNAASVTHLVGGHPALQSISDPDLTASLTAVGLLVRPGGSPRPATSADTMAPMSQQDHLDTPLPSSDTLAPKSNLDHFSASAGSAETMAPQSQDDYHSFHSGASVSTSGRQASGRFRILRLHARGGLGQVSVARDEELRRDVALKEIQIQHANDNYSRSRFIMEAEITGGLEHPGIVPVYGLGVFEDGRPYYAMRFIQGDSLKDAIERFHKSATTHLSESEYSLTLRKLVRNIIEVCNAIEYSHSRGVVHRDLKPANIMLGKFGETLVVDWGLAKAMGETSEGTLPEEPPLNPTMSGTAATVMGSVVGTPQFMSPEQAAGRQDVLGPASDIYSIGATLYSVLTGKTPISDTSDLATVLQRVQRGDILRPRQLNPKIDPPLEAVCLKAMAVNLTERYPSARELAADLERWLADEQVKAYHEPWNVRLARWMRRHRSWVQAGGAALLIVAIVSAAAAAFINFARNREALAKKEATSRSKQAREAIDTLLTGVGETLSDYPGMQDARNRLLEKAAEDYKRLAEEKSGDLELQAESGRAFVRLGDVRVMLNQLEESVAAYNSAIALFKNLVSLRPGQADYQLELGNAYTKLGIAETTRGQHAPAAAAYQEAIKRLQPLAEDPAAPVERADAYGTALVNLGKLENITNQDDASEKTLKSAIDFFKKLQARHSDKPRVRHALASAQNAYGLFLIENGQDSAAAAIFRAEAEEYSSLVDQGDKDPELPDYFRGRGTSRIYLARALRDLGRLEEEIAAYNAAVEDYEGLQRALPDLPIYRHDVALTRTNYGQAANRLGQNTLAEEQLALAEQEFDSLSNEFPIVPDYLEGLAVVKVTLARVRSELGRHEEALPLVDEAISLYGLLRTQLPNVRQYQERLGVAHSIRGRILSRLNRPEDAVAALQQARAELESVVGAEPRALRGRELLAQILEGYGELRLKMNDEPGARDSYDRARQRFEGLTIDFPHTARLFDDLAWFLVNCPITSLSNPDRALQLARRAIELSPESPRFHTTLGTAYYAGGNYEAAKPALAKAKQLMANEDGPTLFYSAMTAWRLKEEKQALEDYKRGVEWAKQHRPADEDLQRLQQQAKMLIQPEDPTPSDGPPKADPPPVAP